MKIEVNTFFSSSTTSSKAFLACLSLSLSPSSFYDLRGKKAPMMMSLFSWLEKFSARRISAFISSTVALKTPHAPRLSNNSSQEKSWWSHVSGGCLLSPLSSHAALVPCANYVRMVGWLLRCDASRRGREDQVVRSFPRMKKFKKRQPTISSQARSFKSANQ